MYRYDGLVIYQNHDDEGILEVVERNGLRSLHFGSTSRQSAIDLGDPEALQLPYAKAMMSWLLFKDSVDDALVIGLGGGSLVRYLLHHFPECRIKAIEYRASVVKIARSHFGLPLDTRLKVIVDDGAKVVRQQAQDQSGLYGLIIVDAFDVDGLAGSVSSQSFFEACKTLLKPDGILLVNLWQSEMKISGRCMKWLKELFADKMLNLPVRGRGNIIAVALNSGISRFDLKDLKLRAEMLEMRYDMAFPAFLKDFVKNNSYTIHSVINT